MISFTDNYRGTGAVHPGDMGAQPGSWPRQQVRSSLAAQARE